MLRSVRWILITCFCSFLCKTFAQNDLQIISREDIFIQAPFQACHAPTICATGKKELIAAWFGGTQEGNPDVCIWASFRRNRQWSAPVMIADGVQDDGSRLPCWNPVLFLAHNRILYLYYKTGKDPRHFKAFYKTSADSGITWSAAVAMPDSLLGPIKNKPVQLKNGDILYPSSRESDDEKSWTSHIEKSTADGKRRTIHRLPENAFGIIQPTLLTYADGRIQALFRSRQNVIVQSWSKDNGNHWSPPSSLGIINPNSGIDAVTLRNGLQLLVYNPMKAGANWWEGRSVLKVAYSRDGIQWKDIYTLEEHADGEYSYPAIIEGKDQHVHIVYTAKRKTIRYVELSLGK